MKLSIKEKAGIDDVSRIYEGLHLSESFIRNSAINPESITSELLVITKGTFAKVPFVILCQHLNINHHYSTFDHGLGQD